MSLIELDISIWGQPHRLSQGWGHVVQIGDYFDGDLPGGFCQSLRYAKRDRGMPEVDYDQPHEKFSVSPEAFAALARELDGISYSFKEHPFTPMLGGGFYGLVLSRGRQDFVLSWHGLFQDQEEQIKNVYRTVERLAGLPATTVGWRTGVYPAGQFPPKDRQEPE